MNENAAMHACTLLRARLLAVVGGALAAGCSGSSSSPTAPETYGPTAECNTSMECIPSEVCYYETGPATQTGGGVGNPTQACVCQATGTFDCSSSVVVPPMSLYCYESPDENCLVPIQSAQIQANLEARGIPFQCGTFAIAGGPAFGMTNGGIECCYTATFQGQCGGRPLEIGSEVRRASLTRRSDWT